MAQLQLKVSTLTATKTFTDAKATAVLDRFFEATAPIFDYTTDPPTPITYTNQEKLDFIVEEIGRLIIHVARERLVSTRRSETETALEAELITIEL